MMSRGDLRAAFEAAATRGIDQGSRFADLVGQVRRGELSPFESAYFAATVIGGKVAAGAALSAREETFVRALHQEQDR